VAIVSPFVDGTVVTKAQLDVLTNEINAIDAAALPIGRQVGRTATLSVLNTTWSSVSSFDGGTLYNVGDIAYAAGVFTVGTAGLYEFEYSVTFPSTTTSHSRALKAVVNGSDPAYLQGQTWWTYPAATVGALTLTGSGKIPLNIGDQVTPQIYQSSGSTLVVNPRAFALVRTA
jgi:hypothetical protein